jgi:hypothetical protein
MAEKELAEFFESDSNKRAKPITNKMVVMIIKPNWLRQADRSVIFSSFQPFILGDHTHL